MTSPYILQFKYNLISFFGHTEAKQKVDVGEMCVWGGGDARTVVVAYGLIRME